MFLISGTYQGNFLRSSDGQIKLPPDLSYFDFRNYKGAIPSTGDINLIIQKIKFGLGTLASAHLMISLCVKAKDGAGRDGFFACRLISPKIGTFPPDEWFTESIAKLYKYLRNDAPLANGAITHIPQVNSSALIDLSGLASEVDSKRSGSFNVNWLSERSIRFILTFLNDRLLQLPSFTLIFGNDADFRDSLDEKIYDWYEDHKFQTNEKERKQRELEWRRRAAMYEEAKIEELWEFLYQVADFSCVILMIFLSIFYFIFTWGSLSGSDPMSLFCFVALIVGFGRLIFKVFIWSRVE